MGVLNILFALMCGCANMAWVSMDDRLREGASLSAAEFTEIIKEEAHKERARNARKRGEAPPDQQGEDPDEVAERLGEAFYRALQEAAVHPDLVRLDQLATAGMILQAALLLSGALLLGRMSIGRTIGIIACVGLVGVYALGADVVGSVMDPFAQEAAAVLEDLPALNTQEVDARQIAQIVEAIHEHGASQVSYLIGGLFAIYPLIAGLVLLFSSGIRNALRR